MLRLDKLHPVISGNKWFKLKYNLEAARGRRIITFGGAWSNHILATAAACKIAGLACTGIIRGERPAVFSATLLKAQEYGMELVFVSRETYKNMLSNGGIDSNAYIIPEGGNNPEGIRGAAEILSLADTSSAHTDIICATGTGTTLAGLISSAPAHQHITGISVLKGPLTLPIAPGNWSLQHDFHEGGYAKAMPRLYDFMNDFFRQTAIPLDRVYTGKMAFAVQQLIQRQHFKPGSRLLLIHTGGLQGNDSIPPGVLCF